MESCFRRCKVKIQWEDFSEDYKILSEEEFVNKIDLYANSIFMNKCLTRIIDQYSREEKKQRPRNERVTAHWRNSVKHPAFYTIYCTFSGPDIEEKIVKAWKEGREFNVKDFIMDNPEY